MKDVLVIIPVYNEEENIEKVVLEVKECIDFADILIVDDCSTDKTLEIVKKLKQNYISLAFNIGYSGVLQTGFKYAVGKNYQYIIQFDGDGQHIASEAVKLYTTMKKTNSDIVIGSRFINNNKEYRHSFFRKLGTGIFRFLIKRICKIKITDPTSGFQVLNRKAFSRYSKMFHYPEYPDANLIIEMIFNGFKIAEIDVKMRNREKGESMHSGIIPPIKYMIKVLYGILILLIKYINFKKK